MTPSNPIILANGSRKSEHILNNEVPFIFVLPIIHINIPAGIATIIARYRTFKVLSINDLIIVFIISGFRYGGSSKVKDDGIPLRNVMDSTLDIISVIMTLKIISSDNINAQ